MSAEPEQLSSCCVSGHIHTGTPQGTFQSIDGINTYVSKPENGSKAKTLVLLTDVFGPQLPNAQFFADEWAKKGWYAYIPDLFNGDGLSPEYLYKLIPADQKELPFTAKIKNAGFMASLAPWMLKHREAVTKPIVERFLKAIRADAETGKIVGIGFCFGGRYAVLFGRSTETVKFDAVIAYHPSLVSVPSDLNSLTAPTALLIGDKDNMIPSAKIPAFKSALISELGEEKVLVKVYPGQVHGFAMRGDSGLEEEMKSMKEAREEGIAWAEKWAGTGA